MNAKELRIGNQVMVNHKTDLEATIVEIAEERIEVVFERQPDLVNGLIISPDKVNPIPITEEWLLKFGFKKVNDGDYIYGAYYTVFIRKYNISISNNHGYIADIKYVHQLQNLYFALTGEELTIKN